VADSAPGVSISFWLVSGGVGWLNGSLFLVFDSSARLARIAPLERAYFVVARRRKGCPLPPPQRGAWRDP
jgi:hypothetical protein